MQRVVGIVRAIVVELRNPGVGAASARDVVAGVVDGRVTLVEHVDLAGIHARLVTVVGGEGHVVTAARSKRHVGFVTHAVGERRLARSGNLLPFHGHAAEPVPASVIFDRSRQLQLVGLHEQEFLGKFGDGLFVGALLGGVAGVERQHASAVFVLFLGRTHEGVNGRTLAGFFDNLRVGVTAGKGFLEAGNGKARIVVDEHRLGLRLVARDDVYAEQLGRRLVEVLQDGVAVTGRKPENPERTAVVLDLRPLGVAAHRNLAAPELLVVDLDRSDGHVFHVDVARTDFGRFEGLEHHVPEEHRPAGLQDDAVAEFGEAFDGDFVEGAILDNELALAVDAAFGTDKPADAVTDVDVAVDGPAASGREVDGFGTVVDGVLDSLRVIGTGVLLSAVVAGDRNPVVRLLFGVSRRFGYGHAHGLLGAVAQLLACLGGELDNLVTDKRFAEGLLGTLDLGLELARHHGAREEVAFVDDGGCPLGLAALGRRVFERSVD